MTNSPKLVLKTTFISGVTVSVGQEPRHSLAGPSDAGYVPRLGRGIGGGKNILRLMGMDPGSLTWLW